MVETLFEVPESTNRLVNAPDKPNRHSTPEVPESWSSFLSVDAPIVSQSEMFRLPMREFLGHIKNLVIEVTTSANYHNKDTNYISDAAWSKLVDGGVMAPFLKERNPATMQEEVMQITRILSYYDLPLGLTYGIVGGLGIATFQRYGSEEQQKEFLGIVRRGDRVGFAITEYKHSGTAALDMVSSYSVAGDQVTIDFSKHLQGLSGTAGLIVAAKKTGGKSIGLTFVPQAHIDSDKIQTPGLRGICYAINTGKVTLDSERYFLAEIPRRKLREFQDIFTKSRLLFIGMTLGHQERMEIEAFNYAEQRNIGLEKQNEIPSVRRSLDELEAQRRVSEAMFYLVLRYEDDEGRGTLEADTLDFVPQANIVKSLSSRYASSSANERAKLRGGGSYYPDAALQDYINIWPFQIFEGPEPFLNTQIGRLLLRHFPGANGEHVPAFSKADKYTNFLGFFEKSISQRALFNGPRTLLLLEDDTKSALEKILPEHLSDDLKEVIGSITSRMFALGSLNPTGLKSRELSEIIFMLNHEIRVHADKFKTRRKNAIFVS